MVAGLIGILATLGLLTAQSTIQRARAGATATQMAFIRTGLLNDPGLYYDLRRLTTRLDSLTIDFKAHPRKYINLTIF